MTDEKLFIIIPCFNEGETIIKLLSEIVIVLKGINEKFSIIIVDDFSTDDTVSKLISFRSANNFEVKILSLEYNLGHQGAIAQGIMFAHESNATCAIIMDGDGEDNPQAIPELLKYKQNDIVHVIRGKRYEKLRFRFAYKVYKILFRLLTSKKMNFGNYCLIGSRVIGVINTRTFIHFAAFLSKQNFKSVSVIYDRRNRIGGKSKMKMSHLIHHAFRSFAEYSESMLMVFLKLFVLLFVFFILTIAYIIYLKIFTTYAILGWSSTFGIGLLTSALLCMGFFVMGVMLLNLSESRKNQKPVALYKIIK